MVLILQSFRLTEKIVNTMFYLECVSLQWFFPVFIATVALLVTYQSIYLHCSLLTK